jgi:hypothetical protein
MFVMKKAFALFAALAVFVACGLSAQKVGEAWPDTRGLVVKFSDGHSMNLRMEENRLQMVFLDEKSLVEKPPFAKAIVRLDPRSKKEDETVLVLRPGETASALVNARILRPPHSWNIVILLYPEEDSDKGRITIASTPFMW